MKREDRSLNYWVDVCRKPWLLLVFSFFFPKILNSLKEHFGSFYLGWLRFAWKPLAAFVPSLKPWHSSEPFIWKKGHMTHVKKCLWIILTPMDLLFSRSLNIFKYMHPSCHHVISNSISLYLILLVGGTNAHWIYGSFLASPILWTLEAQDEQQIPATSRLLHGISSFWCYSCLTLGQSMHWNSHHNGFTPG